MTDEVRRQGLLDRVLGAYWDFSGSMRRLLADRPSEATLLSFLLVASLIRYFGQVIEIYGDLAAAGPIDPRAFQTQVGESFVGAVFLAPLAVYVVAAIAKPIAELFGGTGDWFATRAAFAWAYLVTAPLLLARAGLDAVATALGAPGEAIVALALAFGALGLYVLSACLGAAHGFASPRRTALAIGGAVIAIGGLLAALGAGGV